MTVHIEKALVRRVLAGDRPAFNSFLDENLPRLFRFALTRLNGDRDAAKDVVQQTLLKAIQRLDTYRGEAALFTWLCQICRNAAIDYCRANNRDTELLASAGEDPEMRGLLEVIASPPGSGPAELTHAARVREIVLSVLDHLPRRYGDVLEWKYIEGLSVREIGAKLEVSAKAAESMLSRARRAFREAIQSVAYKADFVNLSDEL